MKKPYVAIVDDDSAFASYLRTFLSLRGYETRSYTRGDELLAGMKQSDPPDVVLLDVMMPGMSGIETLKALKAAKPDVQAIMLSGREQAATIVESVRLGAVDYVVKPDDPEGLGEVALDQAIKSAIEKTRLVSEISELRQRLSDDQDRAFLFWGDSPEMQAIAKVIEQVADSDVTVLIRGESGVGKELVARAIHTRSSRNDRPFVKVNCAALPSELLESELFGHEKGAFTGAATTRIGKFEQADTGTIFLDEIGEMKAALQAKLLHVLQDAQFTKLGSNRAINVDVRVVAATNRDLEKMLLDGEFREDLYYRLKVIEVTVPPLRERRSEVAHLAKFFIDRYARRYNRPVHQLSPDLSHLFQTYDWPGNIRELENMIKRIVILQDEQLAIREMTRAGRPVAAVASVGAGAMYAGAGAGSHVGNGMGSGSIAVGSPASSGGSSAAVAAPPMANPDSAEPDDADDEDEAADVDDAPPAGPSRLADIAKAAAMKAERAVIEDTLRQVQWNRRRAAVQLGVSYKTLLNKIKECGISRK